MKLASYKDGSRDGQLVVVSRDLSLALYANGIAGRLQQVLDDWNFLAPQLQDLSRTLDHGKARHAFSFDPAMCMAPLPRAPRWLRSASGAPGQFEGVREGAGDRFLGAMQSIDLASGGTAAQGRVAWAAFTGDIPPGASAERAVEGVRLFGLLVDWSVRSGAEGDEVIEPLLAAWAPVAVTPDELGPAWQRGRLALPVAVHVDDRRMAAAAPGIGESLGPHLAAASRWRGSTAGTVFSGPLALAADATGVTADAADGGRPESVSIVARPGSRVQVDVIAADGQSLFGALDQVVRAGDPSAD